MIARNFITMNRTLLCLLPALTLGACATQTITADPPANSPDQIVAECQEQALAPEFDLIRSKVNMSVTGATPASFMLASGERPTPDERIEIARWSEIRDGCFRRLMAVINVPPPGAPFRSIWFYEQLASLHGGYGLTQDSVRLFIVPGMGHCGGGVAPNSFDTLQALHNWVTKDVAPEGIVATATNGRTMPLCKFPEEARYLGSGDVNLAANWTCNANDTRMLRVGGNGTAAGADTATALQYLYEPIGLNGQ
jgi:tannase/feruloyl esterase